MATGGKLQDDFLTCSVCMEVFVQPVSLNCQHSFCQNCLRKYIQTKEEAVRNKSIPCPTCRQETPVPHPDRPVEEWAGQLKPGLLLTGLMDSIPQETNCCFWCQRKGKTTPAETWCAECEACLCSDCHKLHNTVPVFDHHEVSSLKGNKQNVRRKHFCKKHDEKIKLFCKDCKKTICTVCCSISHRKCEDVVTVQDMLPEVKGQLRKRKEEFDEKAETNKAQIVGYEDEINKYQRKSTSVKTDITTTIQAAVDHLRAKEIELFGKLDVLTDRQTEGLRSKMKTKKTETQMYQQQSQSIQQALELEDEAQLFEMYLSSGSGAVSDVKKNKRGERSNVADIRFIHNLDNWREEIEKMDVRSVDCTIDLTTTPLLHEVIDAKLDGDVSCSVRDVVVMKSSGIKVTVFTERIGYRLKSVYQRGEETCSSVLKVANDPWCITVISEGKKAVSFTESPNLNIVAVTPDLEVLSTIQTSKNYWGLSSLDQSTLVAGSKNPPSVDLIDMQGTILKTFTTHPIMGKSFIEPRYIHVTSQGTILVSDWGLKSVICLTQSGGVVFTYTPTGDRACTCPWGITSTSSGDILVADYRPHKVIHLSETGDYIRDILTEENGLYHPSGLCVDGDKLCVALMNKGLHEYKFK